MAEATHFLQPFPRRHVHFLRLQFIITFVNSRNASPKIKELKLKLKLKVKLNSFKRQNNSEIASIRLVEPGDGDTGCPLPTIITDVP